MTVRLTTLCENTAGKFGFMGEWGLSILVEYGEDRVLLDAGMTDTIVRNAHAARIDMRDVTQLVISHGHIDHTGGLRPLLRQVRREIEIYAHPDIWGKKYSFRPEMPEEPKNFIGIPFQKEELEYLGASFRYAKDPVWLSDHMVTTGEVPMVTDFEHIDKNLYVETENGYAPDALADDQALVVKTPNGLVVVLGCAHRGMINTLLRAQSVTGIEKIKAVVGGTHLMRANDEQLSRTASMLKELGVEKIGVSHCTGMGPAARLAQIFEENFFFNNAGTIVDL
jgi:7,8-dihydropterin-6-yl-methyl-4-(beta-D-ribofuranosyl)aminobenzene 5'-phosphate synthase